MLQPVRIKDPWRILGRMVEWKEQLMDHGELLWAALWLTAQPRGDHEASWAGDLPCLQGWNSERPGCA